MRLLPFFLPPSLSLSPPFLFVRFILCHSFFEKENCFMFSTVTSSTNLWCLLSSLYRHLDRDNLGVVKRYQFKEKLESRLNIKLNTEQVSSILQSIGADPDKGLVPYPAFLELFSSSRLVACPYVKYSTVITSCFCFCSCCSSCSRSCFSSSFASCSCSSSSSFASSSLLLLLLLQLLLLLLSCSSCENESSRDQDSF